MKKEKVEERILEGKPYYSRLYSGLRSSRQNVSHKKCFPKNLTKFTGKYLRHSLIFNKVEGVACNFIKKEALA